MRYIPFQVEHLFTVFSIAYEGQRQGSNWKKLPRENPQICL